MSPSVQSRGLDGGPGSQLVAAVTAVEKAGIDSEPSSGVWTAPLWLIGTALRSAGTQEEHDQLGRAVHKECEAICHTAERAEPMSTTVATTTTLEPRVRLLIVGAGASKRRCSYRRPPRNSSTSTARARSSMRRAPSRASSSMVVLTTAARCSSGSTGSVSGAGAAASTGAIKRWPAAGRQFAFTLDGLRAGHYTRTSLV